MKPDFTKAAEELKSEGVPVKLAMFNCVANPETAEEYEISGFPTIKLFKNGKPVKDYKGKRTVEDIKKFVKEMHNVKDEL